MAAYESLSAAATPLEAMAAIAAAPAAAAAVIGLLHALDYKHLFVEHSPQDGVAQTSLSAMVEASAQEQQLQ